MAARDRERGASGLRGLVGKPTARAGVVVGLLWIGTAVLLRGEMSEFGPMIAILACASVVLWDTGAPQGNVLRFVLWIALLAAIIVLLGGSPRLPALLALFGAAALWFVGAEPLLRTRSQA